MKKIGILLLITLSSTLVVNAQKNIDPKHTNFYKSVEDISTKEYNLSFFDIVARNEYCKFAVKITNNTNDFILFKGNETVFNFDFGKFSENKKEVFIKPNDSKKRVLEANGGTEFHVEKFDVNVDGFYLVPIKGKIQDMEDFQVPASKNAINHEVFSLKLIKSSLKTQEATLQFECTYKGDKIGLVDPTKLVIKVDGTDKEYANDDKKGEPEMVRKGDEVKFKAIFHIPGRIADMQFANMTILWKDSFVETEEKKLEGKQVSFELDPGLTNGKNK